MSFDNSDYSDIVESGQPLGSKAVGKQGRIYRKGISLVESIHLFSDADNAALWMERARWGDGPIVCPKCGSERGTRTKRTDMPYRCKDCRKFFSVKTGTSMPESKLPVCQITFKSDPLLPPNNAPPAAPSRITNRRCR